jgi:hypothetical protein
MFDGTRLALNEQNIIHLFFAPGNGKSSIRDSMLFIPENHTIS